MTSFEFLLAILGTLLAVSSICVDLLAYARPDILGTRLDSLSMPIRFRLDVAPRDNLRQLLALAGSVILLVFAFSSANSVYIALEVIMLLSKGLWYVSLSADPVRSEHRKALYRMWAAVMVWFFLELFHLCDGFHRIGILGLEILGCAYVMQPPNLRNWLMVLGSGAMVVYAALGAVVEPEKVMIHATFLFLNGIFLAFAWLNLRLLWAKESLELPPAMSKAQRDE